jgi:glycosyltransferase involved in cell wall biosynthesis
LVELPGTGQKTVFNSVRTGNRVRRVKLLVFAHTPPPHHGQSYMVQLLLEGLGRSGDIQCFHVNSRFSDDFEDIGRVRVGKIALVLKYCLQAIALRLRHGIRCIYYIPASPNRAALYRDWLTMALCRPFFSRLIYHWEAAGLGEWLEQKGTAWERLVSRWLLGRPELSVVLTEYNRRDADYFRSKRTAVVPNGVPDPCAQLSSRERKSGQQGLFNILFMGLCTREKGIFDATEGVALANSRDAGRFRLLVAGGFWIEEEKVAFEKRVSELRFADGSPQLEYRGFVSGQAKETLFEESDCLLFPTYYQAEALPLVLIEAMARGLPVITTDWRMIPALLPKGYPFVLRPQAPQEIAETLLRLRAQGNQWNLRQHYLDNFTERHFVEKMKAALLSV